MVLSETIRQFSETMLAKLEVKPSIYENSIAKHKQNIKVNTEVLDIICFNTYQMHITWQQKSTHHECANGKGKRHPHCSTKHELQRIFISIVIFLSTSLKNHVACISMINWFMLSTGFGFYWVGSRTEHSTIDVFLLQRSDAVALIFVHGNTV